MRFILRYNLKENAHLDSIPDAADRATGKCTNSRRFVLQANWFMFRVEIASSDGTLVKAFDCAHNNRELRDHFIAWHWPRSYPTDELGRFTFTLSADEVKEATLTCIPTRPGETQVTMISELQLPYIGHHKRKKPRTEDTVNTTKASTQRTGRVFALPVGQPVKLQFLGDKAPVLPDVEGEILEWSVNSAITHLDIWGDEPLKEVLTTTRATSLFAQKKNNCARNARSWREKMYQIRGEFRTKPAPRFYDQRPLIESQINGMRQDQMKIVIGELIADPGDLDPVDITRIARAAYIYEGATELVPFAVQKWICDHPIWPSAQLHANSTKIVDRGVSFAAPEKVPPELIDEDEQLAEVLELFQEQDPVMYLPPPPYPN